MQFCTYGHGLLLLRVSETLFDIEHIIESKNGNLKEASEVLMDIHELRKRRLETYHMQKHPKYFFHSLDEHFKVIFRDKGRRHTFTRTHIDDELSLFPLIELSGVHQQLPYGVFRVDYLRGPLITMDSRGPTDIKGYRWLNNPFDMDLVQFNPGMTKLRTDNQVIYREFIINDQSRVQQPK